MVDFAQGRRVWSANNPDLIYIARAVYYERGNRSSPRAPVDDRSVGRSGTALAMEEIIIYRNTALLIKPITEDATFHDLH